MPADRDQLKVVVTTTQLADFTSAIGGDDIALTSLLAPGGSAHHFEPTPGDLLRLGRADVLVVNGAGLDEFVDTAIEASGFSGTIIDASAGVDLNEARAISAEAIDGQNHAHKHDHADTAENEHDHGGLNPHLYTSPRFARGMAQHIADELAQIDSTHQENYLSRAATFNARVMILDEWIATQFDKISAEDRVLVTGHDSLRYYLHDYDITYAGSLLPGFEDNAEPSAAEIDALIAAIKRSSVKAIFVESSLSPKLARTVAKAAGIKVADEESLYVDSLGPAGSGEETYIGATVHNTRVILESWGAKVDPLPHELAAP